MQPIEGFALQTAEKLFFTVKGLLHPKERVIAYLRYLPDGSGDREQDGVVYRRVYHFCDQLEILRRAYPQYMHHDPHLGIEVQSVERSRIRAIYDPCAFLDHLRNRGAADALEWDALDLTAILQRASGIPWSAIGVSGSVMLGLHQRTSDLDLLVYGTENSWRMHQALFDLYQEPNSPVGSLDRDGLDHLYKEHRADTPLAFDDFCRMQGRKVNEGRFRNRPFFVRFVKAGSEITGWHGEYRYEPVGIAKLQGVVTDNRDAILTPCCYHVRDVRVVEGCQVTDLLEIVSFRGRFTDQARKGEHVCARGSIERVQHRHGRTYHRLVVGGQAGDYLLALTT